MSAVLVFGTQSSDRLIEALSRQGFTVGFSAALPSAGSAAPECDALVLTVGPDELAAADACVRAQAELGVGLRCIAALVTPELNARGYDLVAAGANDFSTDPDDLARRVAARLGKQKQRSRSLSTLVELAWATGGALDFNQAVRLVLTGARRAFPEAAVALAFAARAGENERERVYVLGGDELEQRSIAEFPEAELAWREGRVAVHEAGNPGTPAPVDQQLRAAGGQSLVAVPLLDGTSGFGALSVVLKQTANPWDIAIARALAGLASNACAAALQHGRLEKRRSALEGAYIDRYRELLEANRRLRELSHMKDEFLAICAHDLRSPLNVIQGHARLLLDGHKGPLTEPSVKAIEAMQRQARRMLELVEDLLDLRAIETGRMQLKKAEADLVELVNETVDGMQLVAREQGVVLAREVPEGKVLASVDLTKLREVLTNLLSNALKFTPSGGRVELTLNRRGDGSVVIAVRDTGPGIPADELPRIFERYTRGREGRAQGRGVGLGLAISREIVELHRGSLRADSDGHGSVFTLVLPGAQQQENRVALPRKVPLVLVAEDDADSRTIILELLAGSYEVVGAADGEEAVRIARARNPDLILLDLFMPRLDGFTAMEDLRRDPRTADIPVMILSAQGDELTKVRGLDLGASDYLAKPFSGRELLARVEKTLKMTQQRKALRALAETDALTGLPNFRAFKARLEEEFKRSRRYGTSLSCVMLDLDNLKVINDRLGHAVGNRAIALLGETLQMELRETDFAARYGGDEFVVLLPHTNEDEAAVFAERLRERLCRTFVEGESDRVALKASIGVAALAGGDGDSSDSLWRRADAALYAAKKGGRNRVERAGMSLLASTGSAAPA